MIIVAEEPRKAKRRSRRCEKWQELVDFFEIDSKE
jgi:hypothetical protein